MTQTIILQICFRITEISLQKEQVFFPERKKYLWSALLEGLLHMPLELGKVNWTLEWNGKVCKMLTTDIKTNSEWTKCYTILCFLKIWQNQHEKKGQNYFSFLRHLSSVFSASYQVEIKPPI